MSTKPETTFILSVHRHLPEVYHEKMNNPFRSGCADVWYSGSQDDLWVEYKYEPSLPKSNKNYTLNLSARQVKWLNERYEEGRNVAVILGLPEGGVIYESRYWEVPRLTNSLRECTRTRPELAEWILARTGKSPCKSSRRSPELPLVRKPSTRSSSPR